MDEYRDVARAREIFRVMTIGCQVISIANPHRGRKILVPMIDQLAENQLCQRVAAAELISVSWQHNQ